MAAAWCRIHAEAEPVILEKPGGGRWIELYFASRENAERLCVAMRRESMFGECAVRICAPRDWQSFRQTHFKSLAVGRKFLICPEWEKPGDMPDGRFVIRLRPGLSFGTGQNFTTRFCLEMLEETAERIGGQASFLDIGTGSGVLSIAAAMMGFDPVYALDNDPHCIEQCVYNAALNGMENRVRANLLDIGAEAPAPRCGMVCANLFAGILIECAERIAASVEKWLAVSGFNESQADGVSEAYLRLGFEEIVRDGDAEWCGILFRRTRH